MEKTAATEKAEPGTPLSPSSNNSNVAVPMKDSEYNPQSPSAGLPEDVTVVAFEPDDPTNPHNWGMVSSQTSFSGLLYGSIPSLRSRLGVCLANAFNQLAHSPTEN